MVTRHERSPFLVEVTALARAPADLDREGHEERIWQAVIALESRYGVSIGVQLGDLLDDSQTRAWLDAIEHAARRLTGVEIVESTVGRAEIRPAGSSVSRPTFVGAPVTRDGWYRLGRAVHTKARQSAGSLPVWIRVDALDGFFQLTEWPDLTWPERLDRVAAALRRDLVDAGADHLAGVVVSSSSAVALGATNPASDNHTVQTEHGHGIRRLLADHLARETAVIALREDAAHEQALWAAAYAAEPDWLADDLTARGWPRLEAMLACGPTSEGSQTLPDSG